jgi:hypothetical protein
MTAPHIQRQASRASALSDQLGERQHSPTGAARAVRREMVVVFVQAGTVHSVI